MWAKVTRTVGVIVGPLSGNGVGVGRLAAKFSSACASSAQRCARAIDLLAAATPVPALSSTALAKIPIKALRYTVV
jgi:hypothetical protein